MKRSVRFRSAITAAALFWTALSPLVSQPQTGQELTRAQSLLQSKDYEGAAAILQRLTEKEPQNATAWLLLGQAQHQLGRLEAALQAHLKAADFRQTAPQGMYNAACVYALQNKIEEAFHWLQKVKSTGNIDMSRILEDTDLESIRSDPRFEALLPKPEDFKDPFVEPVRVIHEWVGEGKGDQFGWIARNIGDVDGDDVPDATTSAPTKSIEGSPAGKVYVYSGKSGKLLWTQSGRPGDNLGLGLEAAGDVDADGIPDVIAGAPGAGTAYVYSGKNGSLLLTLGTGDKSEMFGRSVSTAGDLNGDGHDDLLVGAPQQASAGQAAGRVYIYSGKDGSLLRIHEGEKAGSRMGSATAGFKNGTRSFLAVGAPGAGSRGGGRVYVYEGLNADARFIIEADETGAALGGMFVSVVGDVNADGVPDIYASDWSNNAKGSTTGRIYVHSGADGRRLYTLTGEAAGDGFGIGPADAGDVNRDGHDDLIIGAWQHAGAAISGGKVYLYSGKDGSLLRTYTCRIPGDTFGFDATGISDVDGDGAVDFLLTSAWSGIRGFRSGRVFIISSSSGAR